MRLPAKGRKPTPTIASQASAAQAQRTDSMIFT